MIASFSGGFVVDLSQALDQLREKRNAAAETVRRLDAAIAEILALSPSSSARAPAVTTSEPAQRRVRHGTMTGHEKAKAIHEVAIQLMSGNRLWITTKEIADRVQMDEAEFGDTGRLGYVSSVLSRAKDLFEGRRGYGWRRVTTYKEGTPQSDAETS